MYCCTHNACKENFWSLGQIECLWSKKELSKWCFYDLVKDLLPFASKFDLSYSDHLCFTFVEELKKLPAPEIAVKYYTGEDLYLFGK